MPKAALSGLLGVLFLVATTSSVSQSLHQFLHHDDAHSGHICLACSFAKGQVNAADPVTLSVMLVLVWFAARLTARTSPLPGFDYRLSPSRAPPRS